MNYRNLNITTIAGITLMLIVLIGVGFIGIDQLNKLNQTRTSLKHTNDVLIALRQIIGTMQDAETGQRGFLITGREDYLTPYNDAVLNAPKFTAQLHQLIKDDPQQLKFVSSLDDAIAQKFAELKKTIALRRTQGFEQARNIVLKDIGKQQMDLIRNIAEQMRNNELQVMTQRYEEQDKQAKYTFLGIILLCALAIIFQIIMGFITTGFLKGQQLAEQFLKESEERFRLLLSGVRDYAIFMLDPEGKIITWNEGAQRIKGYTAEEIIGKHFSCFYSEEEKAQGKPEKELETALSSGVYEEEEQRIRKDGSKFWANVIIRPVYDTSGRLSGFAKVTRDITERKEMDRRVSEFYSTVSHELRTPLTSIRGTLSLLEGGRLGPLSERALQLIHIARAESDRLIRLINDILDIRKIEAGKLELKFEELSPSEIIDSTFGSMKSTASESSIELISEINTSEKISCDRDRIVQVLTNLLSNAIKFSPANSKIVVQVENPAQATIRFSVIDKGAGIAKDQMSKLFGLFQQLDSSDSRPKGGTGLGLAICKAIVEEHGGNISVDSAPGEGSVFWFELPSKKGIVIRKTPQSHYRTLLVEDDHNLCELLAEILSGEGFSVDEAPSLKEAEKYLADQPKPDVIILDVQLPDGNGLDLLEKLQQNAKTSNTPVVVITGRDPSLGTYGHPQLIDWIKKPFDDQRLLSTLKLALRSRAPGRARVLVVDDDEATRELVKQELAQFNTECFEASDGVTAIHLARTREPDLIILDLAMPSPDGFDVVEILRREKSKTTPLLVYTARDLNEADKEKLSLGLTAHLIKSRTSEEEFLGTVKNLLNGLITEHQETVKK